MKIAFIYDAIYPWLVGGVEKRIYELSRRLALKHEVHIFGIKWWRGNAVIEKNGVYLHGVCRPMRLYINGRRSIKEAIYFALKVLFPLLKEKFDIIDCQEFPYFPCFSAKIYSKLRNSTLVITWHELWDDYWYEYLGRIGLFGKIVEQYVTKLADKNIAVSNTTRKRLRLMGLQNAVVIPNGVDLDTINKIKSVNKYFDIIYVGRLIREKNLHILIKSVKILKANIPDIRCCIIGDGPEKVIIKKLVNDLKLKSNIKIIDSFIDYRDVIYFIKSSKVFVTLSTREGFGIAALEANACGLPVITIKHERNAIKDIIIEGRTGFLCNLSENEIANKIMVAIDKSDKMRKFCINFAKRFDWNNIVKKYNRKILKNI